MAHIGFTPQSEHALGGYRVQGRGDAAAQVLADAEAMEDAGAFAVVMEMVPGDVAAEVTRKLAHPHHRHRRRQRDCDGQVLVWQDAFGLRTGRMAQLRQAVRRRARRPARRRAGVRRRRQGRHLPRAGAHLLGRRHQHHADRWWSRGSRTDVGEQVTAAPTGRAAGGTQAAAGAGAARPPPVGCANTYQCRAIGHEGRPLCVALLGSSAWSGRAGVVRPAAGQSLRFSERLRPGSDGSSPL